MEEKSSMDDYVKIEKIGEGKKRYMYTRVISQYLFWVWTGHFEEKNLFYPKCGRILKMVLNLCESLVTNTSFTKKFV